MRDRERQTKQLIGRLATISGKIIALPDTIDPHVIVSVMGPELAAELMRLSTRIEQIIAENSR